MADDTLRLRATVTDEFSGPLAKLKAALQQTASSDTAKAFRKDWGEAGRAVEKVAGSFNGFMPLMSAIGVGSLSTAGIIAGAATAMKNFANEGVRLGAVAQFTSQTVSQVKAMEEALKAFGQTAEQTDAQMMRLREAADQIHRGTGPAMDMLVSQGLGGEVGRLAKAKTLQEFDELAMEILRRVKDPIRQKEIAEGFYGDPQRGFIARQTSLESYRQMVDEMQKRLGQFGDESTKQAVRFNKAWTESVTEFEKSYRAIMTPLLEGGTTLLKWGNDGNGDVMGHAATALRRKLFGDDSVDGPKGQSLALDARERKFKSKLGRAQSMYEDNEASVPKEYRDEKFEKEQEFLRKEIMRLTDILRQIYEAQNSLKGMVQPQSFNGGGGALGGRGLIQTAGWGGGPILALGYGGGGGYGGGSGGFGGSGGGGGYRGVGSGMGGASPALSPNGTSPASPAFSGSPGGGSAGTAPAFSGGGAPGRGNRRGEYGGIQNTARAVYGALRQDGFSHEQASAVLGNMHEESTLNPNAWNAGERAGGLIQWRLDRLQNLKNFAAQRGNSWNDATTQAHFIKWEIENTPWLKSSGRQLQNARTIEEANAALKKYISYGSPTYYDRLNHGRNYARMMQGIAPSSGSDGDTTAQTKNDTPWHQRREYYRSRDGGYSRLRDDEVVTDPATSRPGDEMMRRHFGRDLRGEISPTSGKGSLHITMDGMPAGTRARASMNDLFKDVAITQRRQVDSSIKGPR